MISVPGGRPVQAGFTGCVPPREQGSSLSPRLRRLAGFNTFLPARAWRMPGSSDRDSAKALRRDCRTGPALRVRSGRNTATGVGRVGRALFLLSSRPAAAAGLPPAFVHRLRRGTATGKLPRYQLRPARAALFRHGSCPRLGYTDPVCFPAVAHPRRFAVAECFTLVASYGLVGERRTSRGTAARSTGERTRERTTRGGRPLSSETANVSSLRRIQGGRRRPVFSALFLIPPTASAASTRHSTLARGL